MATRQGAELGKRAEPQPSSSVPARVLLERSSTAQRLQLTDPPPFLPPIPPNPLLSFYIIIIIIIL